VGLILAKVSVMRISIPIDLSSRSFRRLPCFLRSRRPLPLFSFVGISCPSVLCLLLIDKARVKDKTYISIYECRCDERLKTKTEESTRLTCTRLLVELEHLKIKTTLIDEMFASVMSEYVFLK
jgi:hypothetical protein